MKAVLQRVREASVTVDGNITGKIAEGILVLLGIGPDDGDDDISWLVRKIGSMRIFNDQEGIMNLSVKDKGGDLLVVSQFTLMASIKKGNRPSYIGAARPEIAQPLYEKFLKMIAEELGKTPAAGIFGADMKVSLVNDGPVTLIIDSKNPV